MFGDLYFVFTADSKKTKFTSLINKTLLKILKRDNKIQNQGVNKGSQNQRTLTSIVINKK